jgi:hypothetical protein
MNLSINTIVLSMYSVYRDIKLHEKLNNDESFSDEEQENHGQYVLDLMQVFSELGSAYQELQLIHKEYSELDVLVNEIESIEH